MKDEEYLFYEDIREKAITARSARKVPRRSGCNLKNYSEKELKKLSGQVQTINLKKAMSYEDFKLLSITLKKEYISYIVNTYAVGPTEIANLFGSNQKTISWALRQLGFTFKSNKPTQENKMRFRQDYGLGAAVKESAHKKMTLQNASFCFTGIYDTNTITQQLKAFISDGQNVKITVAVEVAL